MDGAPRWSVVVPAYNEERFLPRLLDSIDVARAAYSRGRDAVEVIVADNASTDATARNSVNRLRQAAQTAKCLSRAARSGSGISSSASRLSDLRKLRHFPNNQFMLIHPPGTWKGSK